MNKLSTCLTFLIFLFISLNGYAQGILTSQDFLPTPISRMLENFNHSFVFTNDFQSSNSKVNSGTSNINSLDASLGSDLSRWTSINGSFLIHFVHISGNNPADKIGDTQMTSNIAVPKRVSRMANFWYQHNVKENVKWLIGIHDMSTEFNVTNSSLNFINSSFGTGAELSYSGVHGPTLFPITTLGSRLSLSFNETMSLNAGIYDGDPGDIFTDRNYEYKLNKEEGAFSILEFSFENKKRKSSIASWSYSRKQVSIESEDLPKARSFGSYLIHEENINDQLSVFSRFGWANPKATMVKNNLALGGNYKGIFQNDLNDEFGVGYSRIQFSKFYLRGLSPEESTNEELLIEGEESTEEEITSLKNTEEVIEIYYHFKLMQDVLLRPDIQYVQNPSGNTSQNNAWVTGIRGVINL